MRNSILRMGVVFAMTAFGIAGCSKNEPTTGPGPGEPTTVPTLGGLQYKVISGEVRGNDSQIEGTGSLVFRNPAAEKDANFTVAFELQDKGSLTVVSNSDVQLNGLEVTFSRNGKVLGVELRVGSESYDLSEVFSRISAEGKLEFSFDVHAHGHVVFFRDDIDEKEFNFDAEVSNKFWGLKLSNASVSAAKVSGPQEPH